MLGTRSDFCIRSRKWSSASQWGRAYFTSITSALSCYQGLNLTYTVTNRVQWPWWQSERCITKQYPAEDMARNNFMHLKPNYILKCYFRSSVCQFLPDNRQPVVCMKERTGWLWTIQTAPQRSTGGQRALLCFPTHRVGIWAGQKTSPVPVWVKWTLHDVILLF